MLRLIQSAWAILNPDFIVWESRLSTTQYVYTELKQMYLLKGLFVIIHVFSHHHKVDTWLEQGPRVVLPFQFPALEPLSQQNSSAG